MKNRESGNRKYTPAKGLAAFFLAFLLAFSGTSEASAKNSTKKVTVSASRVTARYLYGRKNISSGKIAKDADDVLLGYGKEKKYRLGASVKYIVFDDAAGAYRKVTYKIFRKELMSRQGGKTRLKYKGKIQTFFLGYSVRLTIRNGKVKEVKELPFQ